MYGRKREKGQAVQPQSFLTKLLLIIQYVNGEKRQYSKTRFPPSAGFGSLLRVMDANKFTRARRLAPGFVRFPDRRTSAATKGEAATRLAGENLRRALARWRRYSRKRPETARKSKKPARTPAFKDNSAMVTSVWRRVCGRGPFPGQGASELRRSCARPSDSRPPNPSARDTARASDRNACAGGASGI